MEAQAGRSKIMDHMQLQVAETPHVVLQGEGLNMGKKMILLRLLGCPIQCPSCDSFHTWDKTRLSEDRYTMSVAMMAEQLQKLMYVHKTFHLLITGGEPATQESQIRSLLWILKGEVEDLEVDIETVGQSEWADLLVHKEFVHMNWSPKVGALEPALQNIDYKLLMNIGQREDESWGFYNYCLKLVVTPEMINSPSAFHGFIEMLQTKFWQYRRIPASRISLMPLGQTRDEIIKQTPALLEFCLNNGFHFSPRLHILMYDNKRYV